MRFPVNRVSSSKQENTNRIRSQTLSTTFVSRHPGAIDWAREEGLLHDEARIVADFDPETTAAGDLVIGTLPAQVAARICEHGGRYQHLSLDLSPELRGKELSAADMRACNARLEEFFIQRASVSTSWQSPLRASKNSSAT